MRARLLLLCAITLIPLGCKKKMNAEEPAKAGPTDKTPGSPTFPDDGNGSTDNPTSDPGSGNLEASLTTPPNFKVAFAGDQGTTADTVAVLKLIKQEATDLYIIPGDFDYKNNADNWDKFLQENLGDTPVLATVGNHDTLAWSAYAKKLQARLDKMPKAKCEGEIGVKMKCVYDGLLIVLSGVGTKGTGHEDFLDKNLKGTDAAFKLCVWHRTQRRMQAGDKDDETGWPVYEICREQGAIIATAHEHSYSRTHLLSNFEKQTIADSDNQMVLEPGKTFTFVAGLGGKEVRREVTEDSWIRKLLDKAKGQELPQKNGPWFAKIYTANQNAKSGAFFCVFHVDNNPRKAHCYFKNIAGEVVDDFTLESKVGAGVEGQTATNLIGPGQEPAPMHDGSEDSD